MATIDTILNEGIRHLDGQDFQQAIASFNKALDSQPEHPDANHLLGCAACKLGKPEIGIKFILRAIELNASIPAFYESAGHYFHKMHRFQEAVTHFRKALKFDPNNNANLASLGSCLLDGGNWKQASEYFQKSIDINPSNASAHYGLGFALLCAGDFQRGFEEYEWRWKTDKYGQFQRHAEFLFWDGTTQGGKRILIHTEQGYGDTFLFSRYLKEVKAKGMHVILETRKELMPLFQDDVSVDELVPMDAPLPAFDCQCSLLSIPRVLNSTIDELPGTMPYIAPRLKSNIELPVGKKIGLVWAGSVNNQNDTVRSVSLDHYLPLIDCGTDCSFISLQKSPKSKDIKELNLSSRVLDLDDQLNDFLDTASVINELDLLITVDTGVAHLAGAMNKPVWVIVPPDPDWRWLIKKNHLPLMMQGWDTSPWYPGSRIYRRSAIQEIDGIIALMCEDLIRL